MLRSLLQRLVRRAPGITAAAWARVPAAVRARLAPLVYPIAKGRRGSGWVLEVPVPSVRSAVARLDLRSSALDAEAAYRDATRGRTADEVLCRVVPGDRRERELRQLGFRPVSGSGYDLAGKFPTVGVVIVTLDNPRLLAACLDSIAVTTAWPNLEVAVVDNGANPDTRGAVERPRGLSVRWERTGANIGFAAAVNRGAARLTAEYLVLLNDDTVVGPGCIARLVSHLEAEPMLGLVCPVTNEIGNEARVDVGYRDFAGMLEESRSRACRFRGRVRDTRVVPLFCAAIRTRLFEEVGGLDERYEVGMFEDDDLSRTLAMRGYRTGIADDCYVHHVGQASFGALTDDEYLRVWEMNKARYEAKWGARWRPPDRGPT